MNRTSFAVWLCAVALVWTARPQHAAAWDPSTTHVQMVQAAALRSRLHLRWMEDSDLQRGLFTPLRIDPARLDESQRSTLILAMRHAHAATGASGLGGPGACPGVRAPLPTKLRCVEGDLWEMTALGWMQLGVIVELTPRERLLHHFVDRYDPRADRWSDPELPAAVLRARERQAGGALARSVNRTGFAGTADSARAWLDAVDDAWAPQAASDHLMRASFAPEPDLREHHLALALIGIGATLHVVQDLSVPAHARGDVSAFFAPLSDEAGDRGLPLQEFARLTYGRAGLPEPVDLRPRTGGPEAVTAPFADDLQGHILGDDDFEGLVHFTGRRFLSESSVPAPRFLGPELSPQAAADELLAETTGLAPREREAAALQPWPANTGYLVTATGRGLAAFDTDEEGRTRLFLDRRIYRDQAAQLIPQAVVVSASVLDLWLPKFASFEYNADASSLHIDLSAYPRIREPVLSVLREDRSGARAVERSVKLIPGARNRIDRVAAPASNARVVLAIVARTHAGFPIVVERSLPGAEPPSPAADVPVPRPAARSRTQPRSQPLPPGVTPQGSDAPPEGAARTGTPVDRREPTADPTTPAAPPAEPAAPPPDPEQVAPDRVPPTD